MVSPGQILRRLRALFSRARLERDMEDEMRFHLEMEAADQMRAGLRPEDAARRARLDFGGVERWREEGRDARGVGGLLDLVGDLRYAARTLRRSPAFTLVAVATLGLGIGANTAIFSVVNAVLLRPLPYAEPERLVSVWDGGHSRAEFTRVRDRTRALSSAAAYFPGWDMALGSGGDPERVIVALVSADFFGVLGTRPLLGRFFTAGEDAPGGERVTVLSYGLWRGRFGGDSTVVGRRIDLDGVPWTVIGVAPPGFAFPSVGTRAWLPLELDEQQVGPFWGAYGHQIIGRLRQGSTPGQTAAELRGIAEELRLENPVWRPDTTYYAQGITVTPLRERLVKDSRRLFRVLLGAVGLVLLIACANVANLLTVRGTSRHREFAVRSALGAGPARLGRQLLVESMALAVLGGALGAALAVAGTRVLVALLPADTPRLNEVMLDGTALAFTALLSLLTGFVFGVGPALQQAKTDAGPVLAGGAATPGPRSRRVAGALVSLQVALAVILAIGAGLLLRSLSRLLAVDPGFETVQVATVRLAPPRARYATPDAARDLVTRVLAELEGAPGIAVAAVTDQLPFDQTNRIMAMWVDGWTTDPNKLDVFDVRHVTPEFFRAMGIPLRAGRGFTPDDRTGGPPVAIVSETAARRFWSGRNAVGGRIRYPWPGWMEVVGVVADVRNNDLAEEPAPAVYLPVAQEPLGPSGGPPTVVVRASGDPAQALATIRRAVATAAPDVPVSEAQTAERLIERSVAAPRAASRLLLGFGALALLLGAVGTYGLVAYGVEQRSREIAVRMAVGAARGSVVGLVLREGARLAGLGIVAGLLGALALSRLMRGLLYGIDPVDPVAFTVAPAALGLTALLACLAPAIRAARIAPSTALR